VAAPPLELTRSQILAFRRDVGAFDERLPPGSRSLRRAAWAGLQDSMPRAALLSIHARDAGAAPTGTVLIRWEGARQPTVWTVPPPEVDPRDARPELARRYLHVFGPATPSAFAKWAGIGRPQAREVFGALARSLTPDAACRGALWTSRVWPAAVLSPVRSSGPGGALRRT
jgi:Winged helix DNA-binding domain